MKTLKAVIFDCDGVMFDSRDANMAYYNHILAHFGRPPLTPDQSRYVHMHTAYDSVAHLFRNDPRWKEAEAYRKRLSYLPFVPEMKMAPHLRSFLDYLRPRYKTAVATNRSDTMERVLEAHGLQGCFDLVVTSLQVKRPKPDPEALFMILEHFAIAAHETVYIGDSEVDEQAAAAAAVPLVAYRNRGLAAAYHVDGFRELEALIKDHATASKKGPCTDGGFESDLQ